MKSWLSQVGKATEAHRERRARSYERVAARKRAKQRFAGSSEQTVNEAGRWHEQRAKGQRERIERVEQCNADILVITCQACGLAHERPARCGCRLLCVRCRGAMSRRLRMRFLRARRDLLSEAEARGLLSTQRRGGRWSEKLFTLTAPHQDADTLEQRIERLLLAWKAFLRLFNTWLRKRKLRSVEWLRVFEWTPGTDERGHPHFHVWIFSPYLDRELLIEWWNSALLEQGCVVNGIPIIDIRAVHDPESVALELVKYLTKDIDSNGDKIDPVLYARVYCALDGHRSAQPSRGFMKRGEAMERTCECGASLPRRVKRKPKETEIGESAS